MTERTITVIVIATAVSFTAFFGLAAWVGHDERTYEALKLLHECPTERPAALKE